MTLVVCLLFALATGAAGQKSEGQLALDAFEAWMKQPAHASLSWDETLRRYRDHLLTRGLAPDQAERNLGLALAHYEGVLYDRVYSGAPEFRVEPNRLLVEAVKGVEPGRALDVGIGQGRNAVFLAKQGWRVTGFDVSAVGIATVQKAAAAQRLSIRAIHVSDQEFDFSEEDWELIAILYAIEKRSVFRVKDALRPGGLVVVEGAHRGPTGADWEFESNELLHICAGFKILKCEEVMDSYDWAPAETLRMVRLVAQKPL
ncbi:class I SAM-dependent methyltransferase [Luteitalea sp.]